jgi:hypothetical protein
LTPFFGFFLPIRDQFFFTATPKSEKFGSHAETQRRLYNQRNYRLRASKKPQIKNHFLAGDHENCSDA